MLKFLARVPRWLTSLLAALSAALLLAFPVVTKDMKGRGLLALTLVAMLFAAVAIAVPQLQQWQKNHDARIRVILTFVPPAKEIPAWGIGEELAQFLAEERDECLAPLRQRQAPVKSLAPRVHLDLDELSRESDENDPFGDLTLGELEAIECKRDRGEVLTEKEEAALEELKSQFRPLGQALLAGIHRGVDRKPDPRTPDQYVEEVELYLAELEDVTRQRLRQRYIDLRCGTVRLTAANPTDRPFEGVQFVVEFPGKVEAVRPERIPFQPLPWRPRAFGEPWREPLPVLGFPRSRPPEGSSPYIGNSAPGRICFDPITLRPKSDNVEVGEFVLFISEPAGAFVEGIWSATAANAEGRLEGRVYLRVGNPQSVMELVREV